MREEFDRAMRDAKIAFMKFVIQEEGGNLTRTARRFEVNVSTIRRRVNALGLRAWLESTYPVVTVGNGAKFRRGRKADRA